MATLFQSGSDPVWIEFEWRCLYQIIITIPTRPVLLQNLHGTITKVQFMWCSGGSCYGVKVNGDVVEQSCSKGVNCRETFWPWGSLSVTQLWLSFVIDKDPRGWNVSLQFTPLLCDCSTILVTSRCSALKVWWHVGNHSRCTPLGYQAGSPLAVWRDHWEWWRSASSH